MLRPQLPLNALRAFEAAARHQNFTRAALELCVSQAALSHQIRALEDRLGVALFNRLPRGVALTDEGARLYPVLNEAFDRIAVSLDRFVGGHFREVLSIGVVGTFATGWLLPRLADFSARHADIELRLQTHNNRIDLAGEGLDLAIRFGDGDWQGQHCTAVLDAPFAPLCAPALARGLRHPRDLANTPLLRSYRSDEWPRWLQAAGAPELDARGPVFDSSLTLASAAAAGAGVALLPLKMFEQDLAQGRLIQPFAQTLDLGRYWLTRLRSRTESDAARRFREWLQTR
ncbi:LysR family transcriptional regulator [Stenotrophomonas rhizophila]|uniref:LysR family transcriptional regulator n=1 Tax=Stenotrophomonas rhizophila TaxID=216778 RepID=UPI001E615BC9|nr:LysR family transcriptional regulator [Stenotrophomonas rhizophila]MCC7632526.1 LysR family transcriptional regulator [Stenotrophomonas rhizophila]MCC7663378.1 LysR family transcriptional regulator [Stenotrophomonas rhizophila]